jgi:hypothetical protein
MCKIRMRTVVVACCFLLCCHDLRGGEEPVSDIAKITAFERDGKWRDALTIYQNIASGREHNPDGLSAEFCYRKGFCEYRCGHYREAEASLRKVSNISTKKLDDVWQCRSLFVLVQCHIASGRIEEAKRSLDVAIRFANNCEFDDPAMTRLVDKFTHNLKERLSEP